MVYWASFLTAIGWYVLLATSWPKIFQRERVKHATREDAGYRIGWSVHWQLPARMALLVAGLSLGPLFTVVLFDGWLAAVLLASMSATLLVMWVVGSPGQILVYVGQTEASDGEVFRLQRSGSILRPILVLLLLGLLPALGIALVLGDVLTEVVR
jgi:hypothetical protein